MANYKAMTMAYLDSQGIKYSEVRDNVIRVGYTADNIKDLAIFVFFDENNNNYVQLRTAPITNFGGDKMMPGLTLINQLNHKYRWVKFVIDSDNDLIVEMDAIVDEDSVGAEVRELIGRTVTIVDQAYPDVMRIVWG